MSSAGEFLPAQHEKGAVYQVFFPSLEDLEAGCLVAEKLQHQGTAFLLHRSVFPCPPGYRCWLSNHHVMQNALEAQAKGLNNLGYVRSVLQPTTFFRVAALMSDASKDIALIFCGEGSALGQDGFTVDYDATVQEGARLHFGLLHRIQRACCCYMRKRRQSCHNRGSRKANRGLVPSHRSQRDGDAAAH